MSAPGPADIRYPIGPFRLEPAAGAAGRERWIAQLAALPDQLAAAVAGLNDRQLDTPYRAGGWSGRQITHHVADEHLNAFAYVKMALTEDEPAIRKYSEPLWAETSDARRAPPELSLTLLRGLHARWVLLLRSLEEAAFRRCYVHPSRGDVSIDHAMQLYAWHGLHHTAQITGLRAREGW
jgi:hypothetical protein